MLPRQGVHQQPRLSPVALRRDQVSRAGRGRVGIGRDVPCRQHPRRPDVRGECSGGPRDDDRDFLPCPFSDMGDRGGAEPELNAALTVAQFSLPALDDRARERRCPRAGETLSPDPPREVRGHFRGPVDRRVAFEAGRNLIPGPAHGESMRMGRGDGQSRAHRESSLERFKTQGPLLSRTDSVNDRWLQMEIGSLVPRRDSISCRDKCAIRSRAYVQPRTAVNRGCGL